MGVYIKGMEMPPNCWACACYHHKVDDGYYDYDVCQASGTVFNDGYSSATGNKTHIDPFKQRLDNCPLVPVPQHGRCIDADALYGVVQKRTRNWAGGWNDIECVLTGKDIKNAPTIIEAEGASE